MLMQNIAELLRRGLNIPLGNPLDPNMAATPPFNPQPSGRLNDLSTMLSSIQDGGPQMAPEQTMVENVPTALPSPSIPAPSAEVPPTKKRGGLLGALESVFMPEPDSRWAAALRGGIWDAKANQQLYREDERGRRVKSATDDVNYQTAQAKLKNLLTKGEYQIAGNNVIHFPPNGGEPRVITPPATLGETERLLDAWKKEQDPAVKDMIESLLLKANDPDVIVAKGEAAANTAEARARATAKYRAPTAASQNAGRVQLPAGAVIIE